VIGFEDYEALLAMGDAAQAREKRFAVVDEIRARNRNADPDEVERVVAETIKAVRKRRA
jgi:hypothetical protein